MYKDKDKQKETQRERQRRYRNSLKGVTKGVADIRCDKQGVTKLVTSQGVTITSSNIHVTPKRGKDIKTFEDLPPDAQECINKMSIKDGKIDQTIKANWIASVISFQRLYPDRYESLVNDILV